MQASGTCTIFGPLPDLSADPASQVGFYAGGRGTALGFGVVGALLAAGAGRDAFLSEHHESISTQTKPMATTIGFIILRGISQRRNDG